MSKFYIQSDYDGRERTAITFSYERDELSYSAVEEWKGQPVVGSVEFVEKTIGRSFKPDYYPTFLNQFLHRKVWWSDGPPLQENGLVFLKPADRHKRFDAGMYHFTDFYVTYGYDWEYGPYYMSEIVAPFTNEWRYYVSNGKILAAHWYSGNDDSLEAPTLNFDFPSDFCGAVDFGISNGKLTLVENNLPYACGWYGGLNEGKIYGEWLENGWKYLKL